MLPLSRKALLLEKIACADFGLLEGASSSPFLSPFLFAVSRASLDLPQTERGKGRVRMKLPQEGQNLRMLFFLTTVPCPVMAALPHRANLTKVQGWRATFAKVGAPKECRQAQNTNPAKHEEISSVVNCSILFLFFRSRLAFLKEKVAYICFLMGRPIP